MGPADGAGPYRGSSRGQRARRGPRAAVAHRAPCRRHGRGPVGARRSRGCAPLMRYEVTLDGRRVRVELGEDGRFTVEDRVVAADVRETVRARQWSIVIEGESHEITVVTHDPLRLDADGHDVRASVIDERALRAGRGTGAARVE